MDKKGKMSEKMNKKQKQDKNQNKRGQICIMLLNQYKNFNKSWIKIA